MLAVTSNANTTNNFLDILFSPYGLSYVTGKLASPLMWGDCMWNDTNRGFGLFLGKAPPLVYWVNNSVNELQGRIIHHIRLMIRF
jgi:hypothetical protein